MRVLFVAILGAAIALSAVAKYEHHQAARANAVTLDASGNHTVRR